MKSKKIFDSKLLVRTIIFLAALMLVFNVIHEMGHGMLCHLAENQFVWGITPIGGGWLVCIGPIEDLITFRLAGGLLASFVATISLLFVLHFGKNRTYVVIPLVAIAASQAVIAALEAFAYDLYMNSSLPHVVSGMITVTLILWLVFRYTKKEVCVKN
jgi:hypothetical protein